MKQYEEDAQKFLDQVVSQALARESQLGASLQSAHVSRAPADPALEQQLKQALAEAEGAQPLLENWRDHAKYYEDRAAEAEEKLEQGGRSGADTPTF